MKKYFTLIPIVIFLFSCGSGNEKAKTTMADTSAKKKSEKSISPQQKEEEELDEVSEKKKGQPQENPYKNAKIEVKVIDNVKSKSAEDVRVGGYGYDIYIFDAIYVHQSNVPAINGNRGFKTKVQAQKAGEFVAYKIKNNIMPPSVSIQELDSLGVLK